MNSFGIINVSIIGSRLLVSDFELAVDNKMETFMHVEFERFRCI